MRKCTNINIEFMKNIFVVDNKNLSGINQKREKTYDLQRKRKRQKVKELRKQKGIYAGKLCRCIGISVRTYSGIESRAHSTSIDTFVEIAEKLNVSLDYVILGQRENNLSIKVKKEEREIIKKFLYNLIKVFRLRI